MPVNHPRDCAAEAAAAVAPAKARVGLEADGEELPAGDPSTGWVAHYVVFGRTVLGRSRRIDELERLAGLGNLNGDAAVSDSSLHDFIRLRRLG